ncbi:hypothetical protein [Elizabethkingia anophelis]|uniref:hypothetical protein n=1 Tax=Elizabethkingia anophelis TaxID=1117645 RepID=UPI00136F7321|nr:hypothetical protein [Elizabethkingia anophelis]MYY27362.1 hypothetical protein [Elizabethkingia anophelis]
MKIKRLLALLHILTFFFFGNAQLQKGNLMIEGNIFSSSLGLNNSGAFNLGMQLKTALFIADNFALGGQKSVIVSGDNNSKTMYNFNFGVVGRYYLNKDQVQNLENSGKIFFESIFGLGGIRTADHGGSNYDLILGLGSGYMYFITPHIAIESLLEYNSDFGFHNAPSSSALTFNVGLQIFIPSASIKQLFKRKKSKKQKYNTSISITEQ